MTERRQTHTGARAGRAATMLATLAAVAAIAGFMQVSGPAHGTSDGARAAAMVPAQRPESFADLIERVKPAVVSVAVRSSAERVTMRGRPGPELPHGTPFDDFLERFFDRAPPPGIPGGELSGMGSGFIVDPHGYVVTNDHVVAHADEIGVVLHDGTRLPATVAGRDPKTDLAVLSVESPDALPHLRFGDSDAVRVGDWVVAVGNPFGLGGSASAGIVSARGRDIRSGPYDDYLQIDAPINRGNSGGPLFDAEGNLIGINTAIFSPSGGNVGVGFAIPSNLARPIVDSLKTRGRVERGWLGVRIQPVSEEIAESLSLPEATGALVADVEDASPADRAGVRPGDVVVEFDGEAIGDVRALSRRVAQTDPERTVPMKVRRGGAEQMLEVRIAALARPGESKATSDTAREDAAGTPRLGLAVAPLTEADKRRYGLPADQTGVLVVDVVPGSPAAAKELRAGDVIAMVGQEPVNSPQELTRAIERNADEGRDTVLLLVAREDGQRFVAVSPAA